MKRYAKVALVALTLGMITPVFAIAPSPKGGPTVTKGGSSTGQAIKTPSGSTSVNCR